MSLPKIVLLAVDAFCPLILIGHQPSPVKPRPLISTDISGTNPNLFDGGQQGAQTVLKRCSAIMLDWARPWAWLR